MNKKLESQILNLLYNKASWEFKISSDFDIPLVIDRDKSTNEGIKAKILSTVEDFCLRDEGKVLEELVDLIRDAQEKKTTEELDKLEKLINKHDKILKKIEKVMNEQKKTNEAFWESAPMIEILNNQRIMKERLRQLREGLVGS